MRTVPELCACIEASAQPVVDAFERGEMSEARDVCASMLLAALLLVASVRSSPAFR
jgi:hypothetical protein